MKVSVVIFSLFLIGNAKGDILADYWKQGAADIGPIDLEPNLNGTNLFLSLTKDIGAFMEEYEKAIYEQFTGRIGYYINAAYYESINMRETVSRADDSTPADAFDGLMIHETNFLSQFIDEMKDYLGGNKEPKASLGKYDSKRKGVQPRLLNRGLSDFLLHLDRILITDFSLLNSYMEEMLLMGRQRIFEHFSEIKANYEKPLSGLYSMLTGFLKNAESYGDKLKLHTSPTVLMSFDNAKNEVLAMIPK